MLTQATTSPAINVIAAAFARGIAPDPEYLPSQWAAENLIVVDGPSAGQKWDIRRVPEFVEIIDSLMSTTSLTEVWFRKSSQIGATTLGVAWVGYLIDMAPDTIMIVQPTDSDVKSFNAETLQETISRTAPLRAKVRDQKSRSIEGSTTTLKRFPGGWLRSTGAHSAAGLRRRTVKYIHADEVDEYPLDLEGQGDPMKMIDARQIAFHASGDYKKFVTSTPTIEGISRIDNGFLRGDQRFRYLPCPHCRHMHKYDFWTLKYSEAWPHNAHYFCPECGGEISFAHQKWMRAPANGAEWRAENPAAPYRSYHLDAMYSDFTTWDHIVKEYIEAKDDPPKLKTFYNLWLGQSFKVKGESPDAEKLFNRRVEYLPGAIPAGGLFLTAGVDVQQNRLEVEVVAWGVGKTTYSIDALVLEGDTMLPDVWNALGDLIRQEWPDAHGNRRRIESCAIDAGYRPQKVYEFVRGRHNAFAIKGTGGHLDPVIGTPTRQDIRQDGKKRKASVMLWPVGTWQIKAEFYALLNLEGPSESGGYPAGWCYYPAADKYDLAFFQQVTSEQLIEYQRRGYIVKEWTKNPKFRNEKLDCRVYAMAAAYKMGMGQWSAEHWRKWVEMRGGPPAQSQLDLLASIGAPPREEKPTPRPPEVKARVPEEVLTNEPARAQHGGGRSVGGFGRSIS